MNGFVTCFLRMEFTFVTILFGLCLKTEMAKALSECSFYRDQAICIDRGLREVPDLPNYITQLDLSLNSIAELNQASFSHLEDLQILKVEQQTAGLTIRNDTFIRHSRLLLLQLDFNLLRLETGAFNGLHNLQLLTLTQCSLDDSILSGDLLRPLLSLEMLVLKDNNIQRIHPASFFVNMKRFHVLDLSYNRVKSICEEDLLSLQGKHFTLLKLSSITLQDMSEEWLEWNRCGNPFKNMSMVKIDLSGNGFKVEMAQRFFNAINGVKIQRLILSRSSSMGSLFGHSNFKNPDKFTFKGLHVSDLKVFELEKSNIFALLDSVFSHFPSLEEISVAENEINIIERDAFKGLTYLQKLNLSQNFLTSINSKTFHNLEKLELLDLSNNHIRVLGEQSFQGLPRLQNLNLTGNALESVKNFAALPNLKKLYFGENRISELSSLPDTAGNITTLDLEFNKLNEMSDLYVALWDFPFVERIYLQGNKFSSCNNQRQTVAVSKLELLHLGLSTMQLIWSEGKCLNIFDHLHQLKQLSLTANGLQSLPKDIFKELFLLEFLDLSFNSLKYLPKGIFPNSLQILNLEYNSIYSVDPDLFSTLSILSLNKNDFHCDCNLKDFQTWLNHTNITLVPSIAEVTCASPEDQYMLPVVKSTIECEEEEDERSIERLRLVLFVSCSLLIALLSASAIIYTHRRGHIFKLYKKMVGGVLDGRQEEPDAAQFQYDVYLCFSSTDIKWVERALLQRLDSQFSEQNTLRCCFEERDFLPGEDHLTNMRSAIQKSRKTLCVVSERFLQDGWCLESFALAQKRTEAELTDILLVMVVGNIPEYKLLKYKQIRSYIENKSYLVWPDGGQDLEWFYDRLLHKINKGIKVEVNDFPDQTKNKKTNVHDDIEE